MRPHWLAPIGAGGTPGTVVSFDTETQVTVRAGAEVLTLRCWDAVLRQRNRPAPPQTIITPMAGESSLELCELLEAAAELDGDAWAFAHNLGFDLTVTSLPMMLTERGWESDFVNIGDESCVFTLRRDGCKLTITDTWSWLRCSLGQAAGDVGMRKTRLPQEDDGLAEWHARCKHDVEILDQLLSSLLDWWDQAGSGNFGVTGAACGWRTMRARVPAKTILVGADGARTRLERAGVFGGRKEVYRVGRITGRMIEDWDLVSAHLTTVANLPLPCRPLRRRELPPTLDPLDPVENTGVVARVEITTSTPCAPVKIGEETWWPVGTFRTVLTTPELAQVLQLAERVQVIEAAWYRTGDHLQEWARWCQQLVAGADPTAPRVVQRVAKGWGRSVPGRFAMRTAHLIGEREATHLGWALESGHDLDTGDPIEIITYGGVERTFRKDQDGQDIFPAVLAWVEGYVRAAMSSVIAARGISDLLQVNTDGWWEIRQGRESPDPATMAPWPYVAARKATSRDVTIIGPNHVNTSSERRLAGVPKDAQVRLDGSYAWHDWPGLRWQLQFSRPGEYTRPGREMMLQDHYCRRWVLAGGETRPVSCVVTPAGETRLLPWSATASHEPGDRLAQWQVPALHALRGAS